MIMLFGMKLDYLYIPNIDQCDRRDMNGPSLISFKMKNLYTWVVQQILYNIIIIEKKE